MSFVGEFYSGNTGNAMIFPRSLVAPPRLPNGLRQMDISKDANIRIQTTVQDITDTSADVQISTWSDTTLYSCIGDALALAPANLEFLSGEHIRNLSANPNDPAFVRVDFERPFVTPPKVVVFLNLIDLDKKYHWRVKTTATNIDKNGFTLGIETWSDSVLYAAQAGWIAYPEDRQHVFSTSVSTMDVRDWSEPQLQQSKSITFNDVEFWKDPTVFVALNAIGIDCSANLRIQAYADAISTTGLTWHLNAWSDTILYYAGASIIAFNA